MNGKQFTVVKEYQSDKPLIHKINSIIDNCFRNCHKKNFIHLIIYVNMILILKISLIMKQLISQFLIKI